MSADLSQLVPELEPYARALVDEAGAAGLLPRVTSTRRSHAEQTRLFRRFLEGGSPYPAAPPGTSAHEYGLAFDLIVSPMDGLSDVGALWREWGGVWGAQRDPVHFELPGAGAAARQLAMEEPESRGVLAGAIDFAAGFIPVYGEVEMFAEILRMFPGFSQSEILQLLAEPSRVFF